MLTWSIVDFWGWGGMRRGFIRTNRFDVLELFQGLLIFALVLDLRAERSEY